MNWLFSAPRAYGADWELRDLAGELPASSPRVRGASEPLLRFGTSPCTVEHMSTPAEAVGANLKRLRAPLSLRRLAQRLREIGHPICADGLNRMEMGRRQASVGDLVALAVVLDVSPATLLMPAERVTVQLTPEVRATWDAAWRWVTGDQPLAREALINPERAA